MKKTMKESGVQYSPMNAELEGEILPGVPGIRFVPSVAAIKKVLEREVSHNEEVDDFRDITGNAGIVSVRRDTAPDHSDGAGGNSGI